jgi:hypothetical protein
VPDPLRRIFTATLILGVPGAGKTSLLATFATYLWETYQRVLLLYSWDGGAIPTGVQKLMKQNLIRFWRARTRSAEGLAIETLYLATKGYWPRRINPETGETSPAVDLVPPVTTQYHVRCPKSGEALGTLPTIDVIGPTFCPACKTLHTARELSVTEDVHRTRGFEDVGGVAFDGLTSMTNEVLTHMDHARGQGQVGGEKSAFGGVVKSGSISLGGTNRADIGFGQSRGQQFVNNSLSIPYLVEGPVFTALAFEASDEGGLPIVGAKLPGRAATDEASSWFGNVAEMGKTRDDAGRDLFTLFLRPFTDAQNRRHLLKTSASPTGLPAMLVDPPEAPWTQANLGLVYTMLDQDLRAALAEDAPGGARPGATPADYGESFAVAPAVAAAASLPPPRLPAAPPAAPTPPVVGTAGAGVAAAAPAPPAPPVATAPPTARRRAQAAAPAPAVVASVARPREEDVPLPFVPPASAPEPVGVASGGAPPPPGMKPPARVPTADTQNP